MNFDYTLDPKKSGRPPGHIGYKEVTYHEKQYMVGNLQSKTDTIWFVIDKEDFPAIKDKHWHTSSNSYISHGIIHDGKRKEVYLHNVVMGRLEFLGKGQKESVDHINRIGTDNRKENLRIITQTEQNLNQKRKGRTIELPPDAEVTSEDIPKHIWYVKANGSHGDRFCIELKTENICWKTTSSKQISLQDKLESAKQKLQELYTLYPYLDPMNPKKIEEMKDLTDSYYAIVELAK